MSLYIDASYESINKYNEELCGDKVEIIRNNDSVIVVLADGLGSGVKANILATLTSKIIGTMLMKGANVDEAVETIVNTLPVCKERGIAYSSFSILQVFYSGKAYLAEFDNPSVVRLRKGAFADIERVSRTINGKTILESMFSVNSEDLIVMFSDGVIHAGIGSTLNMGWQWENVKEYIIKTYKPDMTASNLSKLLLSACKSLYDNKPGDDATVAIIKTRKPVQVNIMIGPPVDKKMDRYVIERFMAQEGKKVVCGGTTSQIVSRVLNREIVANINYFNPSIPPTAEIEGIDLATEGILTFGRALEIVKNCSSSEGTINDFLSLNKQDGASRLAKILLAEGTSVHFFVGRAINPAHQNPEFPLNLSIKLKLVDEMAECLKKMGKHVVVEYY